MEKYLKSSDVILQIGCGNSLLAEQLYDNGFRKVLSIDTDAKVIQKQRAKNAESRPELEFKNISATDVSIWIRMADYLSFLSF